MSNNLKILLTGILFSAILTLEKCNLNDNGKLAERLGRKAKGSKALQRAKTAWPPKRVILVGREKRKDNKSLEPG